MDNNDVDKLFTLVKMEHLYGLAVKSNLANGALS